MKYVIVIAALIAGMTGNVLAATDKNEPDLAVTMLSEVGYPSGYIFEGLQANHEKIFHLYVPSADVVTGGSLVIYYKASSGLNNKSIVRVDVNGVSRASRTLAGDSEGRMEIRLTEEDIEKNRFLKVAIKASLVGSNDYCMDGRLATHYLQIMPNSGLKMSLNKRASSLRGAWDLLPKTVTMSVPGKISESAYGNALMVARYLVDSGKTVKFVEMPKLGDVIVADRQNIEDLVNSKYLATDTLRNKYGIDTIVIPKNKNIYMLSLPGKQPIVISEPFSAAQGEFISSKWRDLAAWSEYDIKIAKSNEVEAISEDRFALPLSALDIDLKTRNIYRTTEWFIPMLSARMGADFVPETLNLEMVSSPSDTGVPLLLQIYLNGVLQKVAALPNDGEPNHVTIHLSRNDIAPGFNLIRIVAQRTPDEGNCRSLPPAYPIQITSNSYLVSTRMVKEPREFRDLGAWFASGVDIYVSSEDSKSITGSLELLSTLISHNGYTFDAGKVHFYSKDKKIDPENPFIVIGDVSMDLEKSGVQFDKGRIRIVDDKGGVLLDVDRLPRVTISQLVRTDNTYGLWIMNKGNIKLANDRKLLLDNDSVAFINEDGLLLSLDPDQKTVSTVDYPDHKSWFDRLGRYSFWFWALLWLMLTLVVVHLYSKSRQHRNI